MAIALRNVMSPSLVILHRKRKMFLKYQKIYMNEVERQIRLDEKQEPNSNATCEKSCGKKKKPEVFLAFQGNITLETFKEVLD